MRIYTYETYVSLCLKNICIEVVLNKFLTNAFSYKTLLTFFKERTLIQHVGVILRNYGRANTVLKIHTYIHTHTHTHTHTYIRTYIHRHIHTYIHIYIHTDRQTDGQTLMNLDRIRIQIPNPIS
jgi:hypothetical protein